MLASLVMVRDPEQPIHIFQNSALYDYRQHILFGENESERYFFLKIGYMIKSFELGSRNPSYLNPDDDNASERLINVPCSTKSFDFIFLKELVLVRRGFTSTETNLNLQNTCTQISSIKRINLCNMNSCRSALGEYSFTIQVNNISNIQVRTNSVRA